MQRLTLGTSLALGLLSLLTDAWSPSSETGLSRRQAFSSAAAFGVGGLLFQQKAWADAGPPTKEDLDRIRKGYEQVNYLLDNFEQETTVCRENGGECKRDANAIRKTLGLRSTTDPLFQIDKVFAKVKYMDMDPDLLDSFFDAAEDWNSAMSLSNSMAFISQFGEYNPGGGKDEVLKYLVESQKQVVIAQKSLKTIIDCLGIPLD
jgi:Ca2+ transporting ATPase